MKTKICNRCNKLKPINEFSPHNDCKYGVVGTCKLCANLTFKTNYQINKTKIKSNYARYYKSHNKQIKLKCAKYRKNNIDKIKAYHTDLCINHPDKLRKYRLVVARNNLGRHKLWRKNNPEKVRIARIKWCKNNPDKLRLYRRTRRVKMWQSPKDKLNHLLSNSIRTALKGNKAGRHWETLVGYTLADLKKDFESKYYNGMTWESFAKGGIDIHHIKPQHTFKFKVAEDPEFKECWALNNLQPLWYTDHIKLHSILK